jgi:hypothetical protein
MVTELKQAIEKIEKLPLKKQRKIGELLLQEIQWESSFESTQDQLSSLAEEALGEYRKGKTRDLDL